MTINTLFYRFFKKHITIVLILSITGCELIGPQLHQKLPLTAVNKVEDEGLLLPQLANQSSFDADKLVQLMKKFCKSLKGILAKKASLVLILMMPI
jgi:hypothetical protein